jgi:UDP-N-acetylglucosamine 2-epimerase (non-hydrolysing)
MFFFGEKYNMKIIAIYGTRPEYLKIKPIIEKSNGLIKTCFVQQHTDIIDFGVSDFSIQIEKTDKNRLNSVFEQIFKKIENIINDFDAILIQGDTATVCATAISCFHLKKKIIYLESGLRTYDLENPFPEEGYRQMISRIADIHLCPTKEAFKNLKKEKTTGKIFVAGNTVLDNLLKVKDKTSYQSKILITLHRNENLSLINEWLSKIDAIAEENKNIEFIYPIHPNPIIQKEAEKYKNIKKTKPLQHVDLINILKDCKLVITDSGGIQEEACFLNKKIIVCRKTTERPEGIKSGHAILCKEPEHLKSLFLKINNDFLISAKCPYGNGKSSIKILKILFPNIKLV